MRSGSSDEGGPLGDGPIAGVGIFLSLEAASLGKSLPQLIGDYTRDYLRCTGVKK